MVFIAVPMRTSCHRRYHAIINQQALDDIGRSMGCVLNKSLSRRAISWTRNFRRLAKSPEYERADWQLFGIIYAVALLKAKGRLPEFHNRARFVQVLKFAEALAKGQRNRFDIVKTVLEDKVREVI